MHAPPPRRRRLASPLLSLAVLLLAFASVARAQLATVVDADSGNTVVVSIATDIDGDPTDTLILSTLTDAAAAADTATETTTSTTDAAAATDPVQGVGQPAVVAQPVSQCTTEGCPPRPTTYTNNGAIVTWYATTPVTPIPTFSTGSGVLNVASYITSVSTANGQAAAAAATGQLSGASRGAGSFLPFGTMGDWGVMAGVAVVGGLVGAVAVL
ncbi:hypothetical protein JCM8097_005227 [Rhodosporidiobolus ruineniae]